MDLLNLQRSRDNRDSCCEHTCSSQGVWHKSIHHNPCTFQENMKTHFSFHFHFHFPRRGRKAETTEMPGGPLLDGYPFPGWEMGKSPGQEHLPLGVQPYARGQSFSRGQGLSVTNRKPRYKSRERLALGTKSGQACWIAVSQWHASVVACYCGELHSFPPFNPCLFAVGMKKELSCPVGAKAN